MTADVVVIGGGVVGSSIALHLCELGVTRVVVIERDTTYARASSSLAFGGVRQLYGSRTNIELARHSVGFFTRLEARVSSIGRPARIGFAQCGYLFLVEPASADRFERRLALQRACGAAVERLTVDEAASRVPGLVLDDIAFCVFGPEDGYLNPRMVLQGMRALAADRGATYVTGEVIGLRADNNHVSGVALSTGDYISTDCIVCAAGAYSGTIGALADVPVPVVPVRQQVFRASLPPEAAFDLPVVFTPPGLHWRYEVPHAFGLPAHIVCAWTEADEPIGERFHVDDVRWTELVAPMLRRYMPAYIEARPVASWSGLYEMTDDHSPLLGAHPALGGFFLACGFSGHGLMLSPAAGATLASLIVHGRSAIDVGAFAPDRFERGLRVDDDTML